MNIINRVMLARNVFCRVALPWFSLFLTCGKKRLVLEVLSPFDFHAVYYPVFFSCFSALHFSFFPATISFSAL